MTESRPMRDDLDLGDDPPEDRWPRCSGCGRTRPEDVLNGEHWIRLGRIWQPCGEMRYEEDECLTSTDEET